MRQAFLFSVLVALTSSGAVNAIPAELDSAIVARTDSLETRDEPSPLATRGDKDDVDEPSDDDIEKILGFKPKPRKEPKGDQKHFQKDKVATKFDSDPSKATDQDHDDDPDEKTKREIEAIVAGLQPRAGKWPFPQTRIFRDRDFKRKCLLTRKIKPSYFVTGLTDDELKAADGKTDPKISYINDTPPDKVLGAYVCDHNLPLQFMAACFPVEQKHWKEYDHDEKISDMDPKAYEFLQKVFADEGKKDSDKKVNDGYSKLFTIANHVSNGFGIPRGANNFLGTFDSYGIYQYFKDETYKSKAVDPPFGDFTRVEGALLNEYRKNTKENFDQKTEEFAEVIKSIIKKDGGFHDDDAEKASKQAKIFIPKFFKASLESELGLTKKLKSTPSGFKKENCNYKAS
ncbi:MAG: hypothetical protein M1836_005090 [Candelina mexicana]|nr:MAG: hypothetical protein M1836_005090 [Candelina mexicana]